MFIVSAEYDSLCKRSTAQQLRCDMPRGLNRAINSHCRLLNHNFPFLLFLCEL